MDYEHDATARIERIVGYIDGQIPLSPHLGTGAPIPAPTPIYSTDLSRDEWHFRDQLTRGHITLHCTDTAALGVKTTGMAREAWDSIQNKWGKSTDMCWSHVQEALDQTAYVEGMDIRSISSSFGPGELR